MNTQVLYFIFECIVYFYVRFGWKGYIMPIRYDKLFLLMEKRRIKKYDLRKTGISPTIVRRLVKNEDINTSTISKLCKILECQPGDIMEYVPDDQ